MAVGKAYQPDAENGAKPCGRRGEEVGKRKWLESQVQPGTKAGCQGEGAGKEYWMLGIETIVEESEATGFESAGGANYSGPKRAMNTSPKGETALCGEDRGESSLAQETQGEELLAPVTNGQEAPEPFGPMPGRHGDGLGMSPLDHEIGRIIEELIIAGHESGPAAQKFASRDAPAPGSGDPVLPGAALMAPKLEGTGNLGPGSSSLAAPMGVPKPGTKILGKFQGSLTNDGLVPMAESKANIALGRDLGNSLAGVAVAELGQALRLEGEPEAVEPKALEPQVTWALGNGLRQLEALKNEILGWPAPSSDDASNAPEIKASDTLAENVKLGDLAGDLLASDAEPMVTGLAGGALLGSEPMEAARAGDRFAGGEAMAGEIVGSQSPAEEGAVSATGILGAQESLGGHESHASHSAHGAELVIESRSWYLGLSKKLFKCLAFVCPALLLSLGLNFWLAFSKPGPVYFAVTRDLRVKEMSPLSEPSIESRSLSDWAGDVVVRSLSLNFLTWRQTLSDLRDEFDPAGFESFLESLKSGGHLEKIEKERLSLSSIISGAPVITQAGVKAGVMTWKLEMPMVLSYESSSGVVASQRLIAEVFVQRTNANLNPRGVVIRQIVLAKAG
jgi:intracellular multiplication protein IcmL